MKKYLIYLVFTTLPAFSFAQNGTAYKDLTDKILNIVTTFKVNEHLAVIQTNIDNRSFELIALNDNMAVLWRLVLNGKAITAGKFNGNVLAVAATGYTSGWAYESPYNGFLINAQTGKLIQQKVIFNSTADTKEFVGFHFNSSGTKFFLSVRQSGSGKSGSLFAKEADDATKSFAVISLANDLSPVISNIAIPSQGYLNSVFNDNGDIFVFIAEGKVINTFKYNNGKTSASGNIIQDVDMKNNIDKKNIVSVAFSIADNDLAYFAMMHKNPSGDRELTVCKLNFRAKVGVVNNQAYTNQYFKSIEKNYISTEKEFSKPDLGYRPDIDVRHLEEFNGTLVTTVSDETSLSNSGNMGSPYEEEYASIISGYDPDLKQKFQQVLPAFWKYQASLETDYHVTGNSVNVLSNIGKGKLSVLYGQLDLTDGHWKKLEKLSKDELGGQSSYATNSTIWFDKNFLITFMRPHGFVFGKAVVDLQSNTY